MIHQEDHCIQNSLDYIFQIKRNFQNSYQLQDISSPPRIIESGPTNKPTPQTNDENKHEKKHGKINSDELDFESQKKSKPGLEIDINNSKVEKFMFDTHPLVKQLSDHYGVSTTILIK